MRIHSLEHAPFEGPGRIAAWAEERGHPLSRTALHDGEVPPEPDAFDLLVVMGGPMSIHEHRTHPWLLMEKHFRMMKKNAIFIVRDHGIGIPEADFPKLYEAFHRAGNVGEIPGTGLGMLIVKRCIDLQQGRIDLESKLGVGTSVTVTIPMFALA